MVLTDILTPEQCAANDERMNKLVELLASREAFLMVGAGSSFLRGYPLWGGLLEELEKKAMEIQEEREDEARKNKRRFSKAEKAPQWKKKESTLIYASKLRDYIGRGNFNILLAQIFEKDRGYSPCHITMVKLPVKGILTANYDRTLQRAIVAAFKSQDEIDVFVDERNQRGIYRFLRSLSNSKGQAPKVVHLHGEFSRLDLCILCGEDYEDKYGITIVEQPGAALLDKVKDNNWTFHRKIMYILLASKRLVYVGFSMADEYFRIMHQLINKDLQSFDDDTHYLLERVTANDNIEQKILAARKLKKDLGIETVFYPDDRGSNTLDTCIEEISQKVQAALMKQDPSTPAAITAVEKPAAPNEGSEETFKELLDISQKQARHEPK